jgi:hypothetical protein
VNDGTYIGFMVLMMSGAILAFFLVPPEKIIRKDGTLVQRVRYPSVAFVLIAPPPTSHHG